MGDLMNTLGPNASIRALIKEANLNDNWGIMKQTKAAGRVTWDEFELTLKKVQTPRVPEVAAVTPAELAADEKAIDILQKFFRSLDANEDKAVSKEELATGLVKDEQFATLVKEAGFNSQFYVLEQLDTNGDGRITWDEFEAHLRAAAREEAKAELAKATAEVEVVQQEIEEEPECEGAVRSNEEPEADA